MMPDCYLVEGNRDAVLYDVTGRRLFLLTDEAYRILRHCEDNLPLSALDNAARARRFVERLQTLGLGCLDTLPAYVDKLLLSSPVKGRLFELPHYRQVSWSLGKECDLSCYFCPREPGGTSWQTCQVCVRRPRHPGPDAQPVNAEQVVNQIADIGAPILHLRGGNPLLHWDRLQAISRAAQHRRILVAITTPGTGRSPDELLVLCRETHVRLNGVMFGAEDRSTAAVCGRTGIYEVQARLLHALQEEGLPFFVTFLLCGATAGGKPEIADRAWELWKARPSFAEIYTRAEAGPALRFTHISTTGKSLNAWRSPPGFYSRIHWNTCLYGTFEISADGCVHPCAGLDAICGRTREGDLRPALAADALYEWWRRNKESLEGCKSCALRLACSDCAAAEQAGVERPELKSSYCPYDPDRGLQESDWQQAGFVDFGTLTVAERENPCVEQSRGSHQSGRDSDISRPSAV